MQKKFLVPGWKKKKTELLHNLVHATSPVAYIRIPERLRRSSGDCWLVDSAGILGSSEAGSSEMEQPASDSAWHFGSTLSGARLEQPRKKQASHPPQTAALAACQHTAAAP